MLSEGPNGYVPWRSDLRPIQNVATRTWSERPGNVPFVGNIIAIRKHEHRKAVIIQAHSIVTAYKHKHRNAVIIQADSSIAIHRTWMHGHSNNYGSNTEALMLHMCSGL